MPIQNSGTLLENLVLLEAARLAFDDEGGSAFPIDFVNSFALPPQSAWKATQDPCYNEARSAQVLRTTAHLNPTQYPALLRSCMATEPKLGPNGALLVGLLARRSSVKIRFWLNDLRDDAHYPEAVAGLKALATLLIQLEPCGIDPDALIVCDQPYPQSLSNLAATLARWTDAQPPRARVAFLDPFRYRIENATGPETSSLDHQRWLSLVAAPGAHTAIAVHFTGHRNWRQLRSELDQLREDASLAGYHRSVTFSHGHYTTTVSSFHPGNPDLSKVFRNCLIARVQHAWDQWFQVSGGGHCVLNIDSV